MRIDTGRLNVFQELPRTGSIGPAAPGGAAGVQRSESPFMNRLAEAVREVNGLQQNANLEATKLATGDAANVQDVVIAMEKADLSLQLTVQVTQRAVEAYREISRMQV